jgi:hypothetical protein
MLADKPPANLEAPPPVFSLAQLKPSDLCAVQKPRTQLLVGVHVLSEKYGRGMVLVSPGVEGKDPFTVVFANDHRVEYSAALAKKKLKIIIG